MRERSFDPRHLDVEAFAERAGVLEGSLPLSAFVRLREATHAEVPSEPAPSVAWRAAGRRQAVRGGGHQAWMTLHADARVPLTCQRCLQAVVVDLVVSCDYRFVADEATAAAADIDADEDLLPTTRSLDLPGLIEDELLMALPLVPRHEGTCPKPLVVPASVDAAFPDEASHRHPFDVLSVLKGRKAPN